ncbi:hypothetical protein IPZ68_12055 [Streptomyces arenae]|nr:hypothetical protein [Streptomyces arenae]
MRRTSGSSSAARPSSAGSAPATARRACRYARPDPVAVPCSSHSIGSRPPGPSRASRATKGTAATVAEQIDP